MLTHTAKSLYYQSWCVQSKMTSFLFVLVCCDTWFSSLFNETKLLEFIFVTRQKLYLARAHSQVANFRFGVNVLVPAREVVTSHAHLLCLSLFSLYLKMMLNSIATFFFHLPISHFWQTLRSEDCQWNVYSKAYVLLNMFSLIINLQVIRYITYYSSLKFPCEAA